MFARSLFCLDGCGEESVVAELQPEWSVEDTDEPGAFDENGLFMSHKVCSHPFFDLLCRTC